MSDTLDTRSVSDAQQMKKNLSNMDSAMARRLEIVEKVAEKEEEIAKLTFGMLESYSNTFKLLDSVATKLSTVSEAYLLLETVAGKIDKSFRSVADSAGQMSNFMSSAADDAEDMQNSLQGAGGGQQPPQGPGGLSPVSLGPEPADIDGSNNVGQIVSDDTTKKMGEELAKAGLNVVDRFADFFSRFETDEVRDMHLTDAADEKTGKRGLLSEDELNTGLADRQKEEAIKKLGKAEEELKAALIDKEYAKRKSLETDIAKMRLDSMKESWAAETAAQNKLNDMRAALEARSVDDGLVYEMEANKRAAESQQKTLQIIDDKRAKYIAEQELKSKLKNGGVLTKEEQKRIAKEADIRQKKDLENLDKLTKKREAQETVAAAAEQRKAMAADLGTLKSGSTSERFEALKNLTRGEDNKFDAKKAAAATAMMLGDFAKQLKQTINEIAGKKSAVDTRLHGSSNKQSAGSYWDQQVKDMTSVGAVNPFFKQADFAENITKLVGDGIAFNVTQRAFLETISNKIATTFKTTDATLLRLVRIQQADSTAGRLGMETALNAFLNSMYENTEYLGSIAEGVRSSLEEMQSLMEADVAVEVEYQVQKWLGSLYSVGMSQSAVSGISGAIGQIAAGQIEGLTGSGAGNLIIMAANDAGISIADMLTRGITAEETNNLMQAAVNYLAELAESAKDNKVVQQQLANVFGVKASDLKAATNLVIPGSVSSIYSTNETYGTMIAHLMEMAGSMGQRTSIAEMMSNIIENGKYTLAGGVASNPVSYMIYNAAKLLDDAAGGIDLPFLNVMGFGVDLNTTVSDLMRVAALGTGILGSLGPMIQGLGNSFSGQAMLKKLGIKSNANLVVTPRGTAGDALKGGGSSTTSGSGYAGNSAANDIKESTIQESEDSKKQQMIEAKEEEEANKVDVLNSYVIKIYELLDDVATGKSSFKVKVDGYGLTRAGSSSSSLGGASGAANTSGNSIGAGLGGDSGISIGSTPSFGGGGIVDFGGWTASMG